MDSVVREIQEPHLGYPMPGIKGDFHVTIETKRGLANLHYQ
jgi:hypothetical protein